MVTEMIAAVLTMTALLGAPAFGVEWDIPFRTQVSDNFTWDDITPTADLRYHDCYSSYKCARLSVPLDYLDPSDARTVSLAIIKLPAAVPASDPTFGGPVLTNPGGPGGSGVQFVRRLGPHLQKVLDNPGKRHYEIVSFDPRGILHTTPRVDCFSADALSRDVFDLQKRGIGGLDQSGEALRRHFAVSKAYGSLCEGWDREGDILPYVSTASVARDMVEIVDREDELRKKERAKELARAGAVEQDSSQQRPMVDDEKTEVARLQYIGFSYGTILGNTFASMFPGRVGRVVMDGVADANDYMKGVRFSNTAVPPLVQLLTSAQTWLRNLQDTEKIVDFFYEMCFGAGPKCPLFHSSDDSAYSIKSRVNAFISAADSTPISALDGKSVTALTGNDIRLAFRLPLYSPIQRFPMLAETIASTMEGNHSLLLAQLPIPSIQDACPLPNDTYPIEPVAVDDAAVSILCSDALDALSNDIAYYERYVKTLKAQSDTFGASWSTIAFACSGWRVRPKWRFEGPFSTPPPAVDLAAAREGGAPAAPLLFLTSRLDPVTPTANAFAMSASHPGSAVVVQDSVGHCAVPTGWSDCMNDILRNYFEHGVVPKNGTRCHSDCRPWQDEGCGLPMMAAEAPGFERRSRRTRPSWPPHL